METRPRSGMYAAFGFHVPFEERLAKIAEIGFEATSMWWEHKNERIRKLKYLAPAMIKGVGLDLESIHVPYSDCNHLWSDDDVARDASLNQHLEWIDDCNRHEVRIMVMHVTLGKQPPAVNQIGIASYETLVRHAEEQGVVVAIENTRVNDHIDALFNQIDSSSLGFCYDISHDVLYSNDPGKLLRDHGARLASTHLADTDGKLDRHWLPGAGSIDYADILQSFPTQTYRGALMLEVSSGRKNNSVPEFIEDARESLNKEIFERIYPNGS
ncbi:MAG: sugar phosphate isomerase/epimerase [Candidatus Hydrogenedentota bacterium]